jgi:hypothetical protein
LGFYCFGFSSAMPIAVSWQVSLLDLVNTPKPRCENQVCYLPAMQRAAGRGARIGGRQLPAL